MQRSDLKLLQEAYNHNKRLLYNRNNTNKVCIECGCNIDESYLQKHKETLEESSKKTDCNGVIIHRGEKFVCIAVGIMNPSENGKTGAMVQVYMLHSELDPVEAQKTGEDAVVCFQCIHRGKSCYVNHGQSLVSIFKSYKNGNYPELPSKNGIPENEEIWNGLFQGTSIRFGAYGEPVLIPIPMLEFLTKLTNGRITGYTHQWRNFPNYKKYFMASVDTPQEYYKAKSMGWRTFRVSSSWHEKDTDETFCKYNLDGTQCIDCLKCRGHLDRGKNIFVKVHGLGYKTKRFVEMMGKIDFDFPPMTEEERKIADSLEEKEKKSKIKNKEREMSTLEKMLKTKSERMKHIGSSNVSDYLKNM